VWLVRGDHRYRVVVRYLVTEADTAASVGSGEVRVLATPRLIAWMEAETLLAAAPLMDPGQTTVGIAVRIEHLRAVPVGESVEVDARVCRSDDARRLTFELTATDAGGRRVAAGEIDRAVVDRERFAERARAQAPTETRQVPDSQTRSAGR
jgi:predicted thioesterase